MPDSVRTSIANLEERLQVEPGFCNSLKEEDDWSLIIKLHALLEAATAHLLAQSFDNFSLLDVFSLLEMSNPRTGKIVFLKKLGLMTQEERRFIRSLSELRNQLIHDIRNVTFDLEQYVRSLKKDQRKKFAQGFEFGVSTIEDAEKRHAFVLADPREAIWRSSIAILALSYLHMEIARFKRDTAKYQREIAKMLFGDKS